MQHLQLGTHPRFRGLLGLLAKARRGASLALVLTVAGSGVAASFVQAAAQPAASPSPNPPAVECPPPLKAVVGRRGQPAAACYPSVSANGAEFYAGLPILLVRPGDPPVGNPSTTPTPTTIPAGTPTPTSVPAAPTLTPAPVGSPTATPMAMESPTPPVSGGSVPACTDHDPTQWHAVAKRNPDGSLLCSYGHEHKDDPNAVADIFGPAGGWFGGSAISYPWATPMENSHKHEVYGWIVRRDLPNYANAPVYVRALRSQTHALGSGGHFPNGMKGGFQSQFHSFSLEAQLCTQAGQCGIVRTGGWIDYGHGDVEQRLPDGQVVATCLTPNRLAPAGEECSDSSRRIHGQAPDFRYDYTWYGTNNRFHRTGEALLIDFGTIGEAWAPVNPANFDELDFYDPERFNGSVLSQEILGVRVEAAWQDASGRVNWAGHTDRHGNFVGGCTSPGVDCVPYVIQQVAPGDYQYRDSTAGQQPADHDVKGPDGKTLIRYPN